jgi:cytochrome c-type biogenesis protein CcmF
MPWGCLIGQNKCRRPPFFSTLLLHRSFVTDADPPIGAVLAWKRGSLTRAAKAMAPIALAIACGLLVYAVQTGRSDVRLRRPGIWWVVGGSAMDLWLRNRARSPGRLTRLRAIGVNLTPMVCWG